jgi:uncharacterized protein (TIGR03437 family)
MRKQLCAVLGITALASAQVLTINPLPTREFGQPTLENPLESNAPNLVEGRELYVPRAIAFDGSVTPPHVYIADTGNNRILGWSNANALTQGNFADLVIGQPDFYSTFPLGPGTSTSTGLNGPTGIAVDANGNLYVADSGSNRILRFKAPYKQPANNQQVDLVIGQKNTVSNQPNQGLGPQSPSANSLALYASGSLITAGLAIDGQGNLWVADVLNNRVLGYPPSNLAANTQLPAATVVLGQNSFVSSALPTGIPGNPQVNLSFVANPSGVAADGQGNLYVVDGYARAIQFTAPLSIGETGKVVLGVPPPSTTPVTYPTASTLGAINSGGSITGVPEGIFVLNGSQGASVFVCDTPQNRVVRYDTFAGTWTVKAPALSPVESGVTGQPDFVSGKVNQGQINPSNATFNAPLAGAINPNNQEMWIVDALNNRVLAFANQGGGLFSTASRVVGQTDFIYGTANLIEGREINISGYGGGIVVDSNSTPPHLYVADSLNNRVLGFNDARKVGTDAHSLLTQKADLVIGQADLLHSTPNFPNGAAGPPSATGLSAPVGLAVDANGNLWVADSGNGRALRFPAPFAQTPGSQPTATVVLGQPDFATAIPNINQFTTTQPFGIAIFANGGAPGSGSLALSDPSTNRILVFNKTGADFTNGQQAAFVIGQPGFTQSGNGDSSSQLNSPRGLAVDSSDRLYVCDSGNNRMMVFSKPTANNPSATLLVPNLSSPQGVTISFLTGRGWVTSTASNVVYQLPEFQTLQNTDTPTQAVNSYGPLAVALDPFDNLIVADSANRITFYFGQLYYRNSASYAAGVNSTAGPTPGMLVEIAREGLNFSFTPSYGTGPIQNMAPPWPLTVSNVQVTVAGFPAPIFRIDPAVIYFEIPNEAPQSGPADVVVTNTSTGQVLAVNTLTMQPASPGLYTSNASGTGQVAASVYDSKGNYIGNNSPSVPATAGGIITLWLTGAGYIPNLPPDGTPPGGSAYPQLNPPLVYINGEAAVVQASQLSPQYPGLWQINVVVPSDTPSSTISPISVVVKLDDYQSNIGGGPTLPNGNPGNDVELLGSNGLITTIYVK